jgi:hypothetical protein
MTEAGTPAMREDIASTLHSVLNYDYHGLRGDLLALYEKAKQNQWNASTDIDWSVNVDVEKGILEDERIAIFGTPIWEKLDQKTRGRLNFYESSWALSQFLHGEQGALLTCGQLVDSVPDIAAKLYASTQVMDEGRHVEVFHRYLNEKLRKEYPIDPDLHNVLQMILSNEAWQVKVLGMQLMVESLAMAAFSTIHVAAIDPLIRDIVKHVRLDEARHVAFGVLSLKHDVKDMPEGFKRDLEDLAYQACVLMHDGFFAQPVYEELGFPDIQGLRQVVLQSPIRKVFRKELFSTLIPNLKQVGLLPERLRAHYETLGVLEYEHLPASA